MADHTKQGAMDDEQGICMTRQHIDQMEARQARGLNPTL